MKLSVIIPYWNPDGNAQTDALLMRAVRSAQDSRPFEIIVVNDGSPSDPDLTSFPEVRYLRREHGMLGATRNTGIEAAKGDVSCTGSFPSVMRLPFINSSCDQSLECRMGF